MVTVAKFFWTSFKILTITCKIYYYQFSKMWLEYSFSFVRVLHQNIHWSFWILFKEKQFILLVIPRSRTRLLFWNIVERLATWLCPIDFISWSLLFWNIFNCSSLDDISMDDPTSRDFPLFHPEFGDLSNFSCSGIFLQ